MGPLRTHGRWVALLALGSACASAPPPTAVPTPAATVRMRVRLRCDGPCEAIERSCEIGCDHMGYDPTPGHDQQHCRDACSDSESDCVRDCEGG